MKSILDTFSTGDVSLKDKSPLDEYIYSIKKYIESVSQDESESLLGIVCDKLDADDIGSLFTFLIDEEIPYEQNGNNVIIREHAVKNELRKRKPLNTPTKSYVLVLYCLLGYEEQSSEIIGVIDSVDGYSGVEFNIYSFQEQLKHIIKNEKTLKDHDFSIDEILEKNKSKSKSTRDYTLLLEETTKYTLGG